MSLAPKARRSSLAWGNAPGIAGTNRQRWKRNSFARLESRLQRSFKIRSKTWGVAPGCFDTAPLALNTDEGPGRKTLPDAIIKW
jgi:hypothetical protein